MPALVTPSDIREAHGRISGSVHRTPMLSSRRTSEELGIHVQLKTENLQKTGSFKARGALNHLSTLSEAALSAGVVTISAGNHAAALAWAARVTGTRCTVVMPAHASEAKARASASYGAEVILHGNVHEAFQKCLDLSDEEGFTLVHPFDDPAIIAGAGTAGLEIAQQAPAATTVVVPVGGGGLISGISAAFSEREDVRVYGVEPETACAMWHSLEQGQPVHLDHVESVADGLAPPMAGDLTFLHVRDLVQDVVRVSDDAIVRAMIHILERTKQLVEPAGAAGLAALEEGLIPTQPGEHVVVLLSGGNVDLPRIGELLDRAATLAESPSSTSRGGT